MKGQMGKEKCGSQSAIQAIMNQIEGFEWDEDKRQFNLRKHGVDFVDACQIFKGDILEVADTRSDYGEERFLAIGVLGDQVLAVVYTLRGETLRLISARKATRNEQETYYQDYF